LATEAVESCPNPETKGKRSGVRGGSGKRELGPVVRVIVVEAARREKKWTRPWMGLMVQGCVMWAVLLLLFPCGWVATVPGGLHL